MIKRLIVAEDADIAAAATSRLRARAPAAARCALHAFALASSAAWSHGVLQPALSDAALAGASRAAMTFMPADPAAAPWWPLVAAGTAVAPAAAATATAALTFGAARTLPTAREVLWPSPRRAEDAAVERAAARARAVFALEAPPERAARRVAAFEAAVSRRIAKRDEARRRADVAAAARAIATAAACAASGGGTLAPWLAALGPALAREYEYSRIQERARS